MLLDRQDELGAQRLAAGGLLLALLLLGRLPLAQVDALLGAAAREAEARPAERFTGCGAGKASPPPCSASATLNAGSGTVSGARAANSAVEDGSAPGSSAAWSGSAGPSDAVASADTCSYAESDVCSDPYAVSPGVAPEFQAVAS
ncbi:hypothetical protein SCALM49S_08337 [Streptomyces californicus]